MRVQWIRLAFALLLAAALSGCSLYYSEREEVGPITGLYLEVPGNDARFGINQSVEVIARATTGPGVMLSEMWLQVNNHDTLLLTVGIESTSADGGVWRGTTTWSAGVPGDHRLRVRAVTQSGEEATSDSITVHIFAQPTPQPIRPGPTAMPAMELMADSTSLTAGSCTTLRWRVSGIQPQSIELNGQPVAAQGEQQVCPCQTTTYDLIVLADDKYVQSVTLNVTGECGTPTSPPPQREISFRADPAAVQAGGCTTLSWKTDPNVGSSTLNGQPVEWYGSQQACNLCAPQTYTLEVVWADGVRDARTVTVNVTGACVRPTQVPTKTPTPTAFPQATINFWADATMIPAGTCTTIHWQTANVQAVYFNGQGVAGEGTYQACPNTTCETYTLDVVLRDGSHNVRTLTVCLTAAPPPTESPTPPRDTIPPPTPTSLKPGNTDPAKPQDLGSCSPVVLRWEPVTDQGGSGLQGYRVSLQRNNNGQWLSLEPYFIIYEPSVDVTRWLGAGWDYRWNVWAIDNAGNHGAPSVWRYFSCPLQ